VSGELASLLLVGVVHLVGLALLLRLLFTTGDLRDFWPADDDGDGGPPPEGPRDAPPDPSGPGAVVGGPPLPDAGPWPRRVRGPHPPAPAPGPARRPEHVPGRDPAPAEGGR
jgi:hypothetical protein